MNDTPQQQQQEPAETRAPTSPARAPKPAAEKMPVIRMDRSRDFSTVHGDRPPGDPHARVCFYQKGLPFAADGTLLVDHQEIAADPAKQAQVMRLAKKAAMLKQIAPGDDADEQDEDDPDRDPDADDDDDETVSLEAWARGDQKVRWQVVSDAITRRFSKRITGKRDALELLVAQGVIGIGGLSPAHRRIVQSD